MRHVPPSVPIRKDGRLRAHLARRGQREQCAGSGQFSARLEIVTGGIARPMERPEWMTAAEFNAVSEWAKADGLYDEWKTMELAGAASPAALASAEDAFRRAWRDAQQLEAALPDEELLAGAASRPRGSAGPLSGHPAAVTHPLPASSPGRGQDDRVIRQAADPIQEGKR